MSTVSAAMIVRNEERCIARCIASLIDAVDEIVVVDTGSTDSTLAILQNVVSYHPKVKVYHFEWVNDFSAARNFSLSKVTSDWVFVVDADEFLDADDVPLVKNVADHYSRLDKPVVVDISMNVIENGRIVHVAEKGVLRIFPTGYNFHFSRKMHESITDSLNNVPAYYRESVKIRLYHDGYDASVVDQTEKRKRNIGILADMIQSDPDDQVSMMYFAREIAFYDREKALKYFAVAERLAKLKGDNSTVKWVDHFRQQIAN